MPATVTQTAIATIVYCAVNTASNIARRGRRRIFGALAAARTRASSSSTAFMRSHPAQRLCLIASVFGPKLIEPRLQLLVGPFAGAEPARPLPRDDAAR